MADRYYFCDPEIFKRLKEETQALFERYPEDDGVMVFLPDKRVQQLEARIKDLEYELDLWRTGKKALYPANEVGRKRYREDIVRRICDSLRGWEFQTYTDDECNMFAYALLHTELHDVTQESWEFQEVKAMILSRLPRGKATIQEFMQSGEWA